MTAAPPRALLAEALHECPGCGLFQTLGPLRPGNVAACGRCGTVLRRRTRNSLSTTLALSIAGLCLMLVAAAWPLMAFRLTGQVRSTSLLHLPVAFEQQDMPLLAIAVIATTLAAPFARLSLTIAVLAGLRTGLTRTTLAAMARLRDWLAPWAMIEVFLLGLFVAYTRLQVLAQVDIGTAAYALAALMLVTICIDTWLDEPAMWDAIGRRGPPGSPAAPPGPLIGCDTCGLVSRIQEGAPCPRCDTRLQRRKAQPLIRSAALMITGAILYIPANIYPVLTVIRLAQGAPSTILGGVRELIEYEMYPLALLVFVASIMVPLLKLVGLSILLVTTVRRSPNHLRQRTLLYRVVDVIGRWSMIDVFMVSILTALVRMGLIGSVTPGLGAVFFASVVIMTMVAALCFDPRVMWDNAGQTEPASDPAPNAVPA